MTKITVTFQHELDVDTRPQLFPPELDCEAARARRVVAELAQLMHRDFPYSSAQYEVYSDAGVQSGSVEDLWTPELGDRVTPERTEHWIQ